MEFFKQPKAYLMKNLIVSFSFLISCFCLTAQTTLITVGGTVSNTDGSPAANVTIHIAVDSTSIIDFQYYESTTTTASGVYLFIFEVPEQLTQGTAFVTMENCENTWDYEVVNWHPGNTDLSADFTYCPPTCSVILYTESSPNSFTTIVSESTGAAPFTYNWDTGQTSPNINITETGSYCVEITDAFGCIGYGCIYVEVDTGGGGTDTTCNVVLQWHATGAGQELFAFPSGLNGPWVYQWNTGAMTSSIIATDPSAEYCVTVTNAYGCAATACDSFYVESCTAQIQLTANGTMVAEVWGGLSPYTYEWNTGETSETIIPNDFGTYCVTITDATGCMDVHCVEYNEGGGLDSSCWVFIEPVVNTNGLLATVNGSPPYTYEWSTGSTHHCIDSLEPGTYCVTVTDAIGCVSTDCYIISGGNPSLLYRLHGLTYPVDSNEVFSNIQIRVYLIQHDAEAGTLTAIDSLDMNNQFHYDFGDVEAGEYLVKAALLPESDEYENYLPTYYGQSLWWDEAETITIPYQGYGFRDVFMLAGENPGGPGFIGGLISEGANLTTNGTGNRSNGNPLANISVLLLDKQDNPITHTVSDENGEFYFENLAYGTYKVYVEILGLEQVFQLVTISPENPNVNDIAFEVGENGISTATSQLFDTQQLQVFPNPVKERINLFINSPITMEATIQVTSLVGKNILNHQQSIQAGQQQLQLEVNTLPQGVYILTIQSDKGFVSRKIVKQ